MSKSKSKASKPIKAVILPPSSAAPPTASAGAKVVRKRCNRCRLPMTPRITALDCVRCTRRFSTTARAA